MSDKRDTEIALYQRLQEQVLVAHGQRDAALAERDSAVSTIKLAYHLAKGRDANSSADLISQAVEGNRFANEVQAIKAERDAALAELAAAKVERMDLLNERKNLSRELADAKAEIAAAKAIISELGWQ